jgi:platelet-activating factor acetylhydrolase
MRLMPCLPVCLPACLPAGLGGNRFMYSTICGELASQGYAVFAVEHTDGSASAVNLRTAQQVC